MSNNSLSRSGCKGKGQKLEKAYRAMRRVRGNLILESWNCFTLTRFVMAAGTVAVLMICRQGARTRCRDAISCAAKLPFRLQAP